MTSNIKIYFFLALCVLFWSGNFVIGRFISGGVEPLELAFFRWLFVCIFLLPSLLFLDLKKIFNYLKTNLLFFILISFLGITLFNTIVYIALQSTKATNALLINSIVPILILILSFLILKTKITKIQVGGIVLSTIGVVFLVLKGDFFKIFEIEFNKGDLWILLSSTVWALYSVVLKFKPKGIKHLELFVIIVYLGFLLLLPWYLSQGFTLEKEIMIFKQNWYFFIYVSFFASLLSFYFWHMGIENIGAERTGQFTHLMPIFGAILAYIFLDERLEYYHIIGALLIGFGIYLSLFLKKVD
ncbi:MAG: DMT family transporter [Halarcobacter sp.]